ncbi:MAG: hypothetical protein RLY86_3487 [Pseudomonadota bacterium]|jgi:8-oxo-dGTP pyrophosphatase MutT (NUDIX family)
MTGGDDTDRGEPDGSNPWTIRSADLRYENPWIRVVHHEVLNPAGSPGIYGVVRFRNRAVGVVPVDRDGHTWLVGQYRFPLDRYSWEIPEGGAPEGQSPADAANRELAEETGLTARHLMEIGLADLSNSVSDETGFLYVAWDLTAGVADPEETERLSLRRLPLREALAMAMDGRITDSLSQIALMKLRLMADRAHGAADGAADLPDELRRALRAGFA